MRAIKNKKSKLFLLGMVGAMVLSPAMVAASCGGSGLGGSSKLNEAGELTIAVWAGNDNETSSKNAALDGFKAAYPDIKAKYIFYKDRVQDLVSWAASGDMPDIVLLDSGDFPELAASKTIVPIDGNKMPTHKTFGGLASNVFAPMVGKVTGEEYQSATITNKTAATIGTDITLDFTNETGAVPSTFSVYGIPKDFSTLVANINKDNVKAGETIPSSFASWADYVTFATTKLNKPVKDKQKGATAIMGSQVDFAREVGMMDATFYNQYKDMSKSALNQAYSAFRSGLKAAVPISEQLFNLRKDGTVATPTEHQYGWNGEAYDNNAVATVVEGNWFTPATVNPLTNSKVREKTALVSIAGISPIYYSGWSLTRTLNDEDAAYKFLEYVTYGAGAKANAWNNGKQSFLTASKTQLESIYADASAIANDPLKLITEQGFAAQSFLVHARALNNARPNFFTRAYSSFTASWGPEGFNPVIGASDTFDGRLTQVLNSFQNKLR